MDLYAYAYVCECFRNAHVGVDVWEPVLFA